MIYFISLYKRISGHILLDVKLGYLNIDSFLIGSFFSVINSFVKVNILRESKKIRLIKVDKKVIKFISIFKKIDLILIYDNEDNGINVIVEEIKRIICKYKFLFEEKYDYNLLKKGLLEKLIFKVVKEYNVNKDKIYLKV
jgi:hypothetical protein